MRYVAIVLGLLIWSPPIIGADPEAKPTPAADLAALQGNWKVSSIYWPFDAQRRLPAEARLSEEGNMLVIDGNRIIQHGTTVATLANDLSLPAQEKEIGFGNNRLLMLTLPDGKGLLCSYHVTADTVQIAYSHGCSCHRGSGQVVYLARQAK